MDLYAPVARKGVESMSIANQQHKVRSTNRFLSGVSVLTVSALIVKVIGLFYKIPLLRCLGTEGMGYFNTAYELYALFCVISTAGLPVAMAVLIARAEAGGQTQTVRRIYRTALWTFLALGATGSLILFGFSEPLSNFLKNPDAATCLRFISPTVFLICLSGAGRGFFQGKGSMLPTAISQVIEALGKLILGLLFAVTALHNQCSIPVTAAFAVLGLTVGTGVSALYLTVHTWVAGRCESRGDLRDKTEIAEQGKGIFKELMATAVPITLSSGLISLTKLLDVGLILGRLQSTGYSAALANSLYGCYSTLAVPIFNILPTLTSSVALSVVPALSSALQRRKENTDEVHRVLLSAFRLTLWLAIPAAMGLFVYAGDILGILFSGEPDAVAAATPWLRVLALSVPAACLVSVCGAMLQTVGCARIPLYAMMVGVVCKIGCAWWILGNPKWGMMGAPVSSLLCDTVIVCVELFFLGKRIPESRMSPAEGAAIFLLPALLAGVSLFAVALLFARTAVSDSGWLSLTRIITVAAVYGIMAGAAYLLAGRRRNRA